MNQHRTIPLIATVKERCRVCYGCVRECPAKAIRFVGGQAEVVPERCIGCGNCVKICSQGAKVGLDTREQAFALLEQGTPVAAIIAPSFPAEFSDVEPEVLVGMVRQLGFKVVAEVAVGADLVARAYKDLIESDSSKRYIATTCPAIVGFVERYHPDLVPNLAPIVSPMVATARVLRKLHGESLSVVFIGPCLAKKAESDDSNEEPEVDVVLTFAELRRMFADRSIAPASVQADEFDGPASGLGGLYPISRGMLQAAGIREDLVDGTVVAADGRTKFTEAIREFESGDLDARLLETLCCSGCVMGAGMTTADPAFRRRNRISQYVRRKTAILDLEQVKAEQEAIGSVDLHRSFEPQDRRIKPPSDEELRDLLAAMGKTCASDELNCGACGYDTCREHAVAIFKGLAENEMCLPFVIEKLGETVSELNVSNKQLANTKEALAHSEKLATMGQLAAGIAHEVNNPLGVVLMYAHLLADEVQDGRLRQDLQMIVEQADRCKKIVSGLLNFARQNKVVLQPTDLRRLVEHTAEVLPAPEGIDVAIQHLVKDPQCMIDSDQVAQVLTNLISNAYEAMPQGGRLTLRTADTETHVRFEVEDSGIGISPENLSRIYQPFFTTKQIGKGTGLGLAVSYGIVKMHRGDIKVESNSDSAKGPTGTKFIVTLPRIGQQE